MLPPAPRSTDRRLDRLTSRERQVLQLIAEGFTNAAIARGLHLSAKTVESLCSNIFLKLDLHPSPYANRRVLAVLVLLNEG